MHRVTDKRTDGQTDNIIMPTVDRTACSTIGWKRNSVGL